MAAVARTWAALERGVESVWKRIPDLVFWLFMLGSAGYLGRMGGTGLWDRLVLGAPDATGTHFFRIDSPAWTAPGLTYEGIPGALLALGEAGAVLVGLVMLFASRLRARVLASMIVVAWASLWAANATALAAKTGDLAMWLMAAAYGVPLVATIIVSMRRMGSSHGGRRGRRPLPRIRIPRRRTPAGAAPSERTLKTGPALV